MPVGRDGANRNKGQSRAGREIPDAAPQPDQYGMGETVTCECGCGETLRELDDRKRRRRYINGHYAKMIWRLYAEATAKGLDMMR